LANGFPAIEAIADSARVRVARRRSTFSWLRRNRRLMAHYKALAIIAEGFAKLAMIAVMLKRLRETKPAPVS
jgi:hypothetical protein